MNIIIEFTNKNQNIREISQAIKIFLKKDKNNTTFTLIGPNDQLFTINDEKAIAIINERDEKEAINKALKISKEKNNVLICFSSINDVIKIAPNVLDFKTKEKTLVTGTTFKTFNYKSPVTLVNIDTINKESFDDMNNSINLFNDYLKTKDKRKEKTYKLLDSKDIFTDELNKTLSEDPYYEGLLNPSELLNPNCDFIIAKSAFISGLLDGFKLSFIATEKIRDDRFNDTLFIKIGKKLYSPIDSQIENTLDKKTRSFGTILLGYNFPIIFGKIDDNLNAILNIFETSLN
jgi:hypothetical protein